MAQEQVLEREIVARAHPSQDGREQKREHLEHAFRIADWAAVQGYAVPHHRGLLHLEQSRPGSPLWVRLTEQELARLDSTLARQGAGQWTPREAERVWGLSRTPIACLLVSAQRS
jgi:hypothetical protein